MIHDLQRHDLLSQQLQRPTHTPFGPGTTGNRDQPALLLAVEHVFDAGTSLLLTLQCRVESFFDEPFPQRLDRPHSHPERLGGLGVLQLRPHLRFIHSQQNVCMTNSVSRGFANPHQLLQWPTFLGLQPNQVLFHVDPP